ncbi:hypothetical protein, partial [Pseudogemmobacter sonorensis]|uniref:hypothetical protein n=1 Tax=Pseudogemmobacter sonorensis TaxID=2989681 RepID=UPI0036B2EF56
PLGDLSDRVTLEVVAEKACAHHGLLASKLAKKAAKKHGAIKTRRPVCRASRNVQSPNERSRV